MEVERGERTRGGFYRMTANSGLGQFASPQGKKPFGRARSRKGRRKKGTRATEIVDRNALEED